MNTRLLFLAVVITAAGALVCPAAVEAQIYVWRDAAGNLVLSDRPKDPSATAYAVPSAPAFRTTTALTGRAAQYQPLIEEHATRHSVSADLIRAVIQTESAFNPRARSPKGAMGLMQLMPGTASDFDVIDPYDPADNIRAGVAYLKQLLVQYSNNVELALAAYNAGPGAVKKYGGSVPPYRETRDYVARVRGVAGALESPIAAPATAPRMRIYRLVEIVDGREVVRYSGTPRQGSELVTTAQRR